MGRWVLGGVLALALLAAPAARGQDQVELPANALNPLLGLTGVDAPENLPAQRNPEPELRPVPRAVCGPGSRPLDGVQGRVSAAAIEAPEAALGYTCNVTPVGAHDTRGGWKTWRYVDRAGRECAYYDASDPHGLAVAIPGPRTGVIVLDMSDPANPVQTDLLQQLPMQLPHESLNLNHRRGLLAAEMGSGATMPGMLSIYDVSDDCRHPVHRSTTLAARFGHESGWSPDGRTYWLAGGVGLAAIDVTDPARPRRLWEGALYSHGLSVSRDGNRLYLADPINGHLVLLDSSEVQARAADPQVREISRLTWKTVSIPQNTAPMTIDGRPYVLEFDEFAFRFTGFPQDSHQVGAARIVDVSDERAPRVVSNLRLEVNQRDEHIRYKNDPGASNPVHGYAAHYCAVPREVDPQIVACSFMASGLRIFDVRDPLDPREVAYYVAPPEASPSSFGVSANYAVSKPAFAPERREVWYTDINSGFHAVRLDPEVWPDPVGAPRPCARHRSVRIRVKGLRGLRVRINGRRARAVRRGGTVRVRVPQRLARKRLVVRVRGRTRGGRRVTVTRRFPACRAGRAGARAAGRVVPPPTGKSTLDDRLGRRVDLVCDLGVTRTAAP